MEEIDVNTSEIPKKDSKLPGYEGDRVPICNIDGGGNALEVANMCDLPTLQGLYDRDTVYIVCLYSLNLLVVP